MAAYLRVIANVPESVGGFDAWIRRLGDSQQRIKGLYGEAAHLDELLSSENLRLADGSIADGVTMNLDVRTEIPIDNVDGKPVRVGSESLDIYIADRRDNPVRVIMSESKVRASNYDEGLKGIKRQFIKHIDAEVMREIEGGNIPKLYYRLQGGAYVGKDPGEISQVMMEYLEEKRPQVFERLVDTEGFIFNADSVAIVSEKLNPFVN